MEWADPTLTAIAERDLAVLRRTARCQFRGAAAGRRTRSTGMASRRRRDGIDADGRTYTAYEVRIVGAGGTLWPARRGERAVIGCPLATTDVRSPAWGSGSRSRGGATRAARVMSGVTCRTRGSGGRAGARLPLACSRVGRMDDQALVLAQGAWLARLSPALDRRSEVVDRRARHPLGAPRTRCGAGVVDNDRIELRCGDAAPPGGFAAAVHAAAGQAVAADHRLSAPLAITGLRTTSRVHGRATVLSALRDATAAARDRRTQRSGAGELRSRRRCAAAGVASTSAIVSSTLRPPDRLFVSVTRAPRQAR